MPLEFKRSWSDEDVERFRDSWVRFVESEMLPHDAEARRRGHVGHELWSQAGELGFLCVDIPEKWGGAGGDFRHEAALHEEMARRALSGMSIGVHSIAAHYLLNHGTDDQKRRYLPRLAKSELVGAIAMTEPGAGSDLQAIRTRDERHGNQCCSDRDPTTPPDRGQELTHRWRKMDSNHRSRSQDMPAVDEMTPIRDLEMNLHERRSAPRANHHSPPPRREDPGGDSLTGRSTPCPRIGIFRKRMRRQRSSKKCRVA